MSTFSAFEQTMLAAGMGDAAIRAFRRNYEALLRNETGLIPESEIAAAAGIPSYESISRNEGDRSSLAQTVVIKLNGGLGTGMGLQAPKSLLEVRPGTNFLDLMVRQIFDLRERSGAKVRLLLMNSFSTSDDTLRHLARYAGQGMADPAEVELMQNMVPKIDAETLAPAAFPEDPSLEWCPPGHGDLFPALVGSGWLDRLLAEGVKYAFVSNSDNLGAVMDPSILSYFAESGAPFLMEVTRRTAADRKGGHLARRKSDGRLLLREVAQCPDSDIDAFQDISRHQYFNTNSLWLRLDLLKDQLAADGGVLPLPMIRNRKTVNPRDSASSPVIQLETAMGAAIECFAGSIALEVPRSRFAPVKTTGDLLALRSDAYELTEGGQIRLATERDGRPPVIHLSAEYKLVDGIEPLGAPSLIACESLTVNGPFRFVEGVKFVGHVTVSTPSGQMETLPARVYQDETVSF